MTEDELADSANFDPTKFNLRNKGIRTNNGKIHKGCVKDAFTKLSIGSIPSNYQSIIYRYEEKKGFGTGQKRFNSSNNMSDIVKTEQEMENQMRETNNTVNVSHSSKGYGPFIAKQKRQWRKYPHSPGPCLYFDQKNKPTTTQSKKRRNCYTREREQTKIKEIASNKENISNPGPGHYDSEDRNYHTLTGWKSSFATKETREGYIPKNSSPGPGCYPPQQSSPKKINQRQFPEGQLYVKMSKEKQQMGKHFLPKQKNPDIPGPGHYDQDIPNFKPLYERIKISHNFIQNNRNRFDQPLQPSPVLQGRKSPTPCTYDVGSSFDKIDKKLIDMSSFMSESKRVVFEGSNNCSQLCYDTVKDPHRNFHFNITGKWM